MARMSLELLLLLKLSADRSSVMSAKRAGSLRVRAGLPSSTGGSSCTSSSPTSTSSACSTSASWGTGSSAAETDSAASAGGFSSVRRGVGTRGGRFRRSVITSVHPELRPRSKKVTSRDL
ncbi:hypothetical protein C8J57DRAFT_1399563 [Mycena rebaudengoi]|nr:hypothetical protein C8J57DRAFT_1399563 [Mycena rebaudengoi]